MSKKAIVIDSSEEEIEKQKKKWQKVKEIGDTTFKISSSGFLITLASPFDFEGPVAEIATAVLAVGGFVTKKIADSKLKELNGEDSKLWTDEDDKDLVTIARNVGNIKPKKEKAADLAKEAIAQSEYEDNKLLSKSV